MESKALPRFCPIGLRIVNVHPLSSIDLGQMLRSLLHFLCSFHALRVFPITLFSPKLLLEMRWSHCRNVNKPWHRMYEVVIVASVTAVVIYCCSFASWLGEYC